MRRRTNKLPHESIDAHSHSFDLFDLSLDAKASQRARATIRIEPVTRSIIDFHIRPLVDAVADDTAKQVLSVLPCDVSANPQSAPSAGASVQACDAFARPQELSGVIHGLRRIHQGAQDVGRACFKRKEQRVMATESKLERPFALTLSACRRLARNRLQALAVPTSVGSTHYPMRCSGI